MGKHHWYRWFFQLWGDHIEGSGEELALVKLQDLAPKPLQFLPSFGLWPHLMALSDCCQAQNRQANATIVLVSSILWCARL